MSSTAARVCAWFSPRRRASTSRSRRKRCIAPSHRSRWVNGRRRGARPSSRCSSPNASSWRTKTRPGSTNSEGSWRKSGSRALEAYALAALGTGGTELPAAVRAGRQLIRLVPLRESGYQLLMRALAAQGNVAEALRVYSNLSDVLRDELGVSPCSATQAVYDQLLRT